MFFSPNLKRLIALVLLREVFIGFQKVFATSESKRNIEDAYPLMPPIMHQVFESMESDLQEAYQHLARNQLEWYDSCRLPWVRHKNLCLQFVPRFFYWNYAENYCNYMGGNLVYFHDSSELDIVHNFFMKINMTHVWYHIGLHRNFYGQSIQWTSAEGNPHSEVLIDTGVKFPTRKFFVQHSGTKRIVGLTLAYPAFFLCRRAFLKS